MEGGLHGDETGELEGELEGGVGDGDDELLGVFVGNKTHSSTIEGHTMSASLTLRSLPLPKYEPVSLAIHTMQRGCEGSVIGEFQVFPSLFVKSR